MRIFIIYCFFLVIINKIIKCVITSYTFNKNKRNNNFINSDIINDFHSYKYFSKNNTIFYNNQTKYGNNVEDEYHYKKDQDNLKLIHHKYYEKPLKTIKIDKNKYNDSIIVSISCNKDKINIIHITIKTLLNQTISATNIILTLSTDEFPMKEKELPDSIIILTKNFSTFKIKWIEENIKDYKKIMVIDDYPKDVIILVNEEIKYPEWFLYEIYSEYVQYGRQCAIRYNISKENDYSIDTEVLLLKKEFMGKYYDEFIKEIIKLNLAKKYISYISYEFAIYLNGYRIRRNHKVEMLPYNFTDIKSKTVLNIEYSDKLNEFNECFEILKKYLYKRYNISYFEMLDAPIVVTMTTYPAREESVVIMLEHFKKQTLKPDLITVWLSETEYSRDIIPLHLKPFVDEGYIELHWTPFNTYGSKRFEIMKIFNNAFVISVDDDFYYPESYIETMYINMIKTNKICVYNSHYNVFKKYKLERQYNGKNDSLYVHIYSGLIGFPPFTFPIQIFDERYIKVRDKYYITHEEIWLFSGLLENDEKIHSIDGIKFYFSKFSIENSQKIGLYKIHLKHHVTEYMIARMVLENNLVEKFKKLHPKFNVYRNIKYQKKLEKLKIRNNLKS